MLGRLNDCEEKRIQGEVTNLLRTLVKRDWRGREPVCLPIVE